MTEPDNYFATPSVYGHGLYVAFVCKFIKGSCPYHGQKNCGLERLGSLWRSHGGPKRPLLSEVDNNFVWTEHDSRLLSLLHILVSSPPQHPI